MSKPGNDAFSRLLDWLENGDSALDAEMEETLREEEERHPAPPPKQAGPKARKRLARAGKMARPAQKKARPAAPARQETPSRAGQTRRAFAATWWYRLLAVILCVALMGLMLFAVVRMPHFGGADTLVDSEVSRFYVENTLEETGAVNIITGIILDYRGFDTLGESHVLFIAACTVLLMLSVKGEQDQRQRLAREAREERERRHEPERDAILQAAARLLTPLILVFGLYIIFNGHLSPGGGFSGGAVLGAGLILYQNAFGYEKTERFFTYKTFRWVSVCALLFYSFSKGYHFFTGANHLENGISLGVAGNILSAGLLLLLNFAVGCVVACTMYALYTMFRKGEF